MLCLAFLCEIELHCMFEFKSELFDVDRVLSFVLQVHLFTLIVL